MRSVSLLLSILLHIGALAFVLYVPLRPAIDLTKPVYQVSLVMGAPGGENLPSPVLGHRPPVTGKQVHSVEAPKPDAKPLAAPEAPEVIKPEALEPKKEAAPEAPKPEPVPEPKKPEPKPEKAPDPVLAPKAPEPKQEEKKKEPEPEKKPEPKPEKKPEPKPEPKKPEPKPEPKAEKKPDTKPAKKAKPEKKKNDVLAAALADARRQANSSASRALADLEKQVSRKGVGGGGGEGDGPGGGGIYDVYVAQVILAVQPNWSMPVYSRSNMVVQVRIKLDPSGKVLDCKVEKSSGRPEFDASAVNAVVRTGNLPAPPTPAQQDLLISFNSLQMMGR